MKNNIHLFLSLFCCYWSFGQTWLSPTINESQLYFNVDGADPSITYEAGIGFVINTKYQDAISFTDGGSTYSNFFIDGHHNKVGVGTSNPLSKLHVSNGTTGQTPHNLSDLTIEDDDHVMISLLSPNTSTAYYGFADTNDSFVGGIQYNHTNDNMYFRVNDHASDMVIKKDGNVGIGTTNPVEKFEVKGKIYLNSGPDDDGIYWARHNMTMGTRPGSYNHNVLLLKPGGASNGLLHTKIDMYVANSESSHEKKVRIHTYGDSYFNGGNVGIGTSSPDAKLAVKGDIHAQEVKVDLNGAVAPDYVFKEGYDIKSLDEVEHYIKQNGHLPNIPSAEEMEEHGLELGEMNLKLLEKIEELTLYLIEQQRVIEGLKQENREVNLLKNEMKEMKKILSELTSNKY